MRILPDLRKTREIWVLAAPIVAGMVSQTVMNVMDTAMVGRLGATALAATGLGGVLSWTILGTFSQINVGTQAVASRRFGEKDFLSAGRALDNAILIAIVIGLISSGIFSFLLRDNLHFFTQDAGVVEEGKKYVFYRMMSGFPLMILMAHRGFFNGIGMTSLNMKVTILVNVVNIGLNYLLIYGNYGFPMMGTAGAGLATAIATFVGMIYFIWLGTREKRREPYQTYKLSNINRDGLWRVGRLALPAGIHALLVMAGISAFVAIVARLGTIEMAATNVCITVWSLAFFPVFGLGVATASLIGHRLGEGNPDAAEAYGWEAAKLGIFSMQALGLLFFLFPRWVLHFFTEDILVVEAGIIPLRMIGVFQIFDSMGLVLSQALEGAGFNKWVLKAEVSVNWGIFLPCTYLFAYTFNGGLIGAWLALGVYLMTYAGLVMWKFAQGEWKTVKV